MLGAEDTDVRKTEPCVTVALTGRPRQQEGRDTMTTVIREGVWDGNA